MSLYLYHATDKNNLDSIMSKGLLKNPGKHNWDGMYTYDGVYLAFDADVAESYVETADVEPEEIVILKIPLDKLNQDYIEYDWNNRCEYVDDINSCVYRKDIPPSCISVTTSDKEPSQDIHDFEGTNMYEWILQTFDEEVETNKEVWGERMNSFMKLTINEGAERRNKLMEKSNFDTIDKAVRYYYPKWYYDDMSVNDIFDELEKLGHSQDFIDAVINGISDKYEDEEDYELDDYDECLEESNVLGMGGGYPNVYLPREAKNYLISRGWTEIELPDLGPCFYMSFPGNDYWEIYIDQKYGGIYVVQNEADIVPTDDIGTIDDASYKRDIDDLVTLGNCLSNGEDFNTCMNNWWGVKESIKHTKKKYVKEDLYHDAQKVVYDFFMKKQWDLNIPEVANYADSVAEQLELDPEFANGTYTMRDWYRDTYWSYPEEIEWLNSTAY